MTVCTQKEIAQQLGISQALVSQVLSGKKKGQTHLHQKILQVGQKLNYLPNHAAYSLKTGQRRAWGLFFPSFEYLADYNRQIIQGIWEVAHEHHRSLSVTCFKGSKSESNEALRLLRERRFDGAFLMYINPGEDVSLEEFHNLGMPTVVVNCPLPDKRTHSVYVDGASGVYQAVKHLIEVHGRRKIAYVFKDKESYWLFEDRFKGYVRAHEELGLKVDPNLIHYHDRGLTYEGYAEFVVKDLLERGIEFDAVFCPNDYVGISIIGALFDHGLDVPGRVSVASFDNHHLSVSTRPRLTTVASDAVGIGKKAAEVMVDLLDHPEDKTIRTFKVSSSLVVRQSCGCVAAG